MKLIDNEIEDAERRKQEANIDFEEASEKVVKNKRVFHIKEMEFEFEAAEEQGRGLDSETSDVESSKDEVDEGNK